MDCSFVVFKTKDGMDFQISKDFLNVISNVSLENMKIGKSYIYIILDNSVKLENVNSSQFKLMYEYYYQHGFKNEKLTNLPMRSDNLKDIVNEWDANFISELNLEDLVLLLNSSESLKCESLAELCYMRISILVRSKISI